LGAYPINSTTHTSLDSLRIIVLKPSGLSFLKGLLCVELLGFWTLYLI